MIPDTQFLAVCSSVFTEINVLFFSHLSYCSSSSSDIKLFFIPRSLSIIILIIHFKLDADFLIKFIICRAIFVYFSLQTIYRWVKNPLKRCDVLFSTDDHNIIMLLYVFQFGVDSTGCRWYSLDNNCRYTIALLCTNKRLL